LERPDSLVCGTLRFRTFVDVFIDRFVERDTHPAAIEGFDHPKGLL
jgi:hypothetical protein